MKEGIIISVPSAPPKGAGPRPALKPAGDESAAGPLFSEEMTGAIDRLDRAEGGTPSLGDVPGKDASQASEGLVRPPSNRAQHQPARDTDNSNEPGQKEVFHQDGVDERGKDAAPKTSEQLDSQRLALPAEGQLSEKAPGVYGALRESSMGLASETGMLQPRIGALENPSRGAVERTASAVLAPANDSQGRFDLPQRGATEGGDVSKVHAGPPPASAVPKRGHSEPTSQGVREGVSRANTKEATSPSGAGHAPRGPERREPHSTGSFEGHSRAQIQEAGPSQVESRPAKGAGNREPAPASDPQGRSEANAKEAITARAAPLGPRALERPEAQALSAGQGRSQGEGKEALHQAISLADGLPAPTEIHRTPAARLPAQARSEQVQHSSGGLSSGQRAVVGLQEIGNSLAAGGSQVVGAERARATEIKGDGQTEGSSVRFGALLLADSAGPKTADRGSKQVGQFADLSVTEGRGSSAEAKPAGADVYITVESPTQGADLRTNSPAKAVEGRTVATLAQDLMQQFDDLEPGQLKGVELRLDPPELGRMNVKVSMVGDEVRVVFSTTQGAAREAIEGALPRLREQLEALGLTLQEGFVGQEHSKDSRSGRGSSERMALGEAPEESGEAEDVKKSSSRRLDLRA